MKAIDGFVAAMHELFAQQLDDAERWQRVGGLMPLLLDDPELRASAGNWPTTQYGTAATNLLFYEDPEHKFVINGLIKDPHAATPIHDHAHTWTAYGVIEGSETVMRYAIADGDRMSEHATLEPASEYIVRAGLRRRGAAARAARRNRGQRTHRRRHRAQRTRRNISAKHVRPRNRLDRPSPRPEVDPAYVVAPLGLLLLELRTAFALGELNGVTVGIERGHRTFPRLVVRWRDEIDAVREQRRIQTIEVVGAELDVDAAPLLGCGRRRAVFACFFEREQSDRSRARSDERERRQRDELRVEVYFVAIER